MDDRHHPATRNDFEIAIICALPLETNAVLCSLDEIWDDAPHRYGRATGDDNCYIFGRSGRHSVVVVTLPRMGKVEASSAARSLRISFSSIKLALLVGTCGAVPMKSNKTEIVLGDVIISEILVELDYGRLYPSGFRRKDTILDAPGRPNEEILGLLQRWKTAVFLDKLQEKTMENLRALLQHPRSEARYPGAVEDRLFECDYIHKHHAGCPECNLPDVPDSVCEAALTAACDKLGCNESRLVPRVRLSGRGADDEIPTPTIHFGSIGTADTVMKSAKHRNQHAESEGVIAFEMEGAGVWDKFNCLIIKGVCDYADSHKNKKWQDYAAAVAASVAKEVLGQYVSHDNPLQSGTPNGSSGYSTQTTLISHSQLGLPDNSDSLPNEIFNRVFKHFEECLEQEQLDTFRATDLRALMKDLKRIQDEQGQTNSLRNLRRIERFIEAVQQIGAVLEDILGSTETLRLIWGPVKLLLQIARGNADLLDTLLSAYEKIGDELPMLGHYREVFKHHVGLQRVLARVFAIILEFHEHMIRLYNGKALKAVFRSLWKDYEGVFELILSEIASHRTLIEDKTRVSYNYTMEAQEIREHLEKALDKRLSAEQVQAEKREVKYHEVRQWIAGAETEDEHNKICRDRNNYLNSGNWILENDKVKGWLSPDPEGPSNSILWINGRPGTGKTYLASIIIEACVEDPCAITSYFYCKEKVEQRTSAIAILRGILLQLLRQHRELVPYCQAKMSNSGSTTLLDLSTASTILDVFCERLPQLCVIIDGVDECEEQRKDLIDILRILVKKNEFLSKGKVRVLLLSRPMNEIKNAIPEAGILALEPDHNKKDIQRYCQHRTRELRKFEFDSKYLKDVVEMICTRADGVFLFAKLVMSNLAKQPTRRRFRSEISAASLPNELNQAYARIIERLKEDLRPEQYEYTELLLGWFVCSKRPLKWTEVQLALSTDLETGESSHEVDMELKLRDDVQELCGSLVQVLKGNRVELVHSTARLFIAQESGIKINAAECDLTLRCLRYLTLDIFRPNISDQELRNYAVRGDLAFQDYAVSSWFLHIRSLIEKKEAFLGLNSITANLNQDVRTRAFFTLLSKISRELEHFVSFYQSSFHVYDISTLEQTKTDCEFFEQFPFYNNLFMIWNHICSAQRGDLESRNEVSIPLLKDMLARNRKLLEDLSTDDRVDLSGHYDEYPFRCPKVLCFYFHGGFKNATVRDNHVNHHNRPFRCTIESCTMSAMGFASNNALTTHMKRFHPEQCDLGESFAPLNRKKVVGAKYECPVCHKRLVRKNILEDHQRTHTGEKPFRCSECGRGFARNYDMKRHEKIHEKRRR